MIIWYILFKWILMYFIQINIDIHVFYLHEYWYILFKWILIYFIQMNIDIFYVNDDDDDI